MSNADETISQLIQRTQKAVEELDNQNYRHQKMLLTEAGLDEVIRDDDIESEPPRYETLSVCLSGQLNTFSLSSVIMLNFCSNVCTFLSFSLSLSLSLAHSFIIVYKWLILLVHL